MACRHGVETERERTIEHGCELDLLVAAQARIGGAARGVFGDEILDDFLGKLVAHVPDVERDAQHVGGTAGVVGILDGAATTRAGAVRLGIAAQGEVDAGDVVSGIDGTRGGNSRVDAPGHGCDNAHQCVFLTRLAACARSYTPGSAARSASTSASVEVWPRLKRSEPRTAISS